MLLNKNLTGTPEEKEEALAKQAKAWERVQEVGKKLHRIFLANDELRFRWIKKSNSFKERFEAVGNAKDSDTKADDLVWLVYSINDAEGRVGTMLSNMVGGWMDKEGRHLLFTVLTLLSPAWTTLNDSW